MASMDLTNISIRIQRPCPMESIQTIEGGRTGKINRCLDCLQVSYRMDGFIIHNAIEEWISLAEFKEYLKVSEDANQSLNST